MIGRAEEQKLLPFPDQKLQCLYRQQLLSGIQKMMDNIWKIPVEHHGLQRMTQHVIHGHQALDIRILFHHQVQATFQPLQTLKHEIHQ